MSKRKLDPLATVLLLLDSLTPEELGTLGDFLRGKQPRKVKDPKSTAPAAKPRSSRSKDKTDSTPNTGTLKDAAGNAVPLPDNPDDFHKGRCAIPGCERLQSNPIHATDDPEYHPFLAKLELESKKAATA